MPLRDLESWMWAEACEMLDRADRLHRQLFRPALLMHAKRPTWEPPVDVYETPDEFVIMLALPGVGPEHASIMLEDNRLVISGQRNLPVKEADIRRLEIPYGQFERCIELPAGRFELASSEFAKGCLLIKLRKI